MESLQSGHDFRPEPVTDISGLLPAEDVCSDVQRPVTMWCLCVDVGHPHAMLRVLHMV